MFRKENDELIKTSCQAQVLWTVRCSIYIAMNVCFMQARELVAEFRHSTGSSKLALPLKDSELDTRSSPPRKKNLDYCKFFYSYRLNKGKTRAVQVFDETQTAFSDTAAFDEAKNDISVSQSISGYLQRTTEGRFQLINRLIWKQCVIREGKKTTKHT